MTDRKAIRDAWLAGFRCSGEGYNGEYPFGDKAREDILEEWAELELTADEYADEVARK